MQKVAGIYSLVVGSSIFGIWILLLVFRQVPELFTEPASIYFHIAAEFFMASLLIISGVGLLGEKSWSIKIFTLSAGLEIYSIINSSGYYAQNGNMFIVLFFMILLILTVIILKKLLFSER